MRLIGRSVGRRLGQTAAAREQALALTGEAGELVGGSVREARTPAAQAGDQAERLVEQIGKRLAGERIADRVVSLADPDARPTGKGKPGKLSELGSVFRLAVRFPVEAANAALPDSAVFVAGQQQPASWRPRKRLAGYRVDCERRIAT